MSTIVVSRASIWNVHTWPLFGYDTKQRLGAGEQYAGTTILYDRLVEAASVYSRLYTFYAQYSTVQYSVNARDAAP